MKTDLRSKKLLVIVESPTKTTHVKQYLQDAGYTNLQVLASVGHIMQLADDKNSYKNSGIYVDNNFELNLKISEDKKKIVTALKEAVKWADKVAIMTDPDREGYVIAWSLINFLKLPETKYFRAITHEITPKAVVAAIENPVKMDTNIVDAGFARMTVDKGLGYSLSPIARNYLGCKSVGRCQSVGLKIVADREKEIQAFVPEAYYELFLNFTKNKTNFRAKYIGTDAEPIDRLKTIGDVKAIKLQCVDDYVIKDITKKDHQESPKPPFCTSTIQQECANKFGLKVKDTMSILQKLFEGGFCTYMRTDSTTLSPEFKDILRDYITENYPGMYVEPRVGKKSEVSQDGHEALRVTDLSLTPDIAGTKILNDLQLKVYKLIWQRTVACALPNAKLAETVYTIYNKIYKFVFSSTELLNAGYRIVYNYSDESLAEDVVKETFNLNEVLTDCELESMAKSTQPPARLTESALVRELEKNGCGRPSTFATIVETVLSESRGYAKLEDKKIVPTERGMQLASYLDRAFPNIINLNYTKELEEDLDKIATGKATKYDFLNTFFNDLEAAIAANKELGLVVEKVTKTCPNCGANLVVKRSRFGKIFYACPNYPTCRHTENIN